jgi:hypothetical protein
MTFAIQRILLILALSLIAVDVAWAAIAHFHIDTPAYGRLALLAAALFGGGLFYGRYRPDPALEAMLMGASFLCAFSAAASVLNYFLITVAGPRIDDYLVIADRMIGFDWYQAMIAMADRPLLNAFFFQVYNFTLPQIALLMITLAWTRQPERVYRFCLAVAAGALIAIFFWAALPSLGAKSMYALPPSVESRLTLSVTAQYGRELVALLHDGPGYITPSDLRGLIAFPSYHGVLALITAFYAWHVRWLRWPALAINLAVVISSPIQGGHHAIDLVASFPVAALALAIAQSRKLVFAVNQLQTEKIASFPTAVFRSTREQKPVFQRLSD